MEGGNLHLPFLARAPSPKRVQEMFLHGSWLDDSSGESLINPCACLQMIGRSSIRLIHLFSDIHPWLTRSMG
uniref:Uncharacterized protein n=1 Tax=Arundo donax TaxID=35708 RepID=A0A0A9DIW0_ARUDO